MSQNEFSEEIDTDIKSQETVENYIENNAIIDFLIQHEQRKDIDLAKIKIPSYLNLNDEVEEEHYSCKINSNYKFLKDVYIYGINCIILSS